ncbi:MAG TPA: hypothetical protein VMW43_06645 [Bacteroidota bacterium]|nr:hypothetical protein [Bacteroidota bacterium]
MSKKETKDLLKFLKPFPGDIRKTALALREFVWNRYPAANELIYDNYNAVAFGWSLTDKLGDTFCSVAVGRRSLNVHFGFYWGSKLKDPKNILLGEGNQYRYILVREMNEFPEKYIVQLTRQAYAYSLSKLKNRQLTLRGATITKSISARKAPPAKRHRK